MIFVDLLSEVDPSMGDTVVATESQCPVGQSRAGQTGGLKLHASRLVRR